MSDAVITVENLSKSYLLGHRSGEQRQYRYTALRDVIGREARNFARKAVDVFRGRQTVQGDAVEEFWALKNVSFEIKQLLRGRVASLLEVGTGFHPELIRGGQCGR
jgi:lipopolysaccharide transport system ATP-binding protein